MICYDYAYEKCEIIYYLYMSPSLTMEGFFILKLKMDFIITPFSPFCAQNLF